MVNASNLITEDVVLGLQDSLDRHHIYGAISSIEDLRCFMEHHVFSVWDFMSLLKCLQVHVSPSSYPWIPPGNCMAARIINEIVLEEESDEALGHNGFCSHFELYLSAMDEIGANLLPIQKFIQKVEEKGVEAALCLPFIPEPSRAFTCTTFKFINTNSPHQIAAVLALGREQIVPSMFRSILEKSNVSEHDAPIFHYYLRRHISLDGGAHASLSLQLLNQLCYSSPLKVEEAINVAREAVHARLQLWDRVLVAIGCNV